MARAAPASTRAAEIISFLTAHPARGFTISELARHLGMNIASAHATLAVLTECGFVVRDPAHRTYVLGPALAVTGFAAMEQHPAIGAAIEQAETLAGQVGSEVGVMAAAGRDVILLARRGPALPASGIGYPGDRSPLLAPIGAVFIAWESEEAIARWLERAALSAPLADMYRRVLAQVRQRGFSVALPGIATPAVSRAIGQIRAEPTDDAGEQRLARALLGGEETILSFDGLAESAEVTFTAIAAPVFDPAGRVLLSLYIAGPPRPVPVRRILELGERLAEAAATATRQARGRAPAEAPPPTARARLRQALSWRRASTLARSGSAMHSHGTSPGALKLPAGRRGEARGVSPGASAPVARGYRAPPAWWRRSPRRSGHAGSRRAR